MTVYHGSSTGGIETLRPFVSNHGDPYVYLTHSEVLAAIYAHNPLTRPGGWFTYCWAKDGRLFYDEYFENQLEEIYSGRSGYVYACEGDFPTMEKMPWVSLSTEPVPVTTCRFIPDLYAQLLQYEREGRLVIRRWQDWRPDQKAGILKIVENSLSKERPADNDAQYLAYVYAHFPELNRHTQYHSYNF